jgi:hypothetical protein
MKSFRIDGVNIFQITKATPEEAETLREIEEVEKRRVLTEEEKERELSLGMKSLWNCEC